MLREKCDFLWTFLRDPQRTGAVVPANGQLAGLVGRVAAEVYAEESRHLPELQLLELGAGTGALTRMIASLQPILVESNENWANRLQDRYPKLQVRAECATLTLRTLTRPAGLVSSIPLINNPQGAEIKQLMAQQYEAGLLRFCVTYTYGLPGPLSGMGFRSGKRAGIAAANLPPASVWVYR